MEFKYFINIASIIGISSSIPVSFTTHYAHQKPVSLLCASVSHKLNNPLKNNSNYNDDNSSLSLSLGAGDTKTYTNATLNPNVNSDDHYTEESQFNNPAGDHYYHTKKTFNLSNLINNYSNQTVQNIKHKLFKIAPYNNGQNPDPSTYHLTISISYSFSFKVETSNNGHMSDWASYSWFTQKEYDPMGVACCMYTFMSVSSHSDYRASITNSFFNTCWSWSGDGSKYSGIPDDIDTNSINGVSDSYSINNLDQNFDNYNFNIWDTAYDKIDRITPHHNIHYKCMQFLFQYTNIKININTIDFVWSSNY